ncbi:MAG: pantetheine-phosphate adenylyltransferase [Clostridiales bacterium]|nr:pantetheine-phosphate adenylyltransferase [Clostridiales bacterium]
MSKTCVFAGTFDPPTVGHKDVIDKALAIFDKVVVAVMINPEKSCLFTKEERLSLLNGLYKGDPRVKVRSFDGAAVDLLREENTPFYVRGVRDCIDFEYENRNRYASEKLMPEIVTVYIPAEQCDLHVSSSLVRSSVKFDKEFMQYIPEEIRETVKKLTEAKNV